MPTALHTLRLAMRDHACDYYFVGSSDPHQNEYTPDCWQRRQAISSFTGSAGDALIGLEQAWLWTDSRYFLQADHELDSAHWQLMKQGIDLSLADYLSTQAAVRVGVDAHTLSVAHAQKLQAALRKTGGELIAITPNLVDTCIDMPARPHSLLMIYPDSVAGESIKSKLQRVRHAMTTQSADYLILSALDDIAWLTNTRANDIAYNPVGIAYGIVGLNSIDIFTDSRDLSDELKAHWEPAGIQTHHYDAFFEHIPHLAGHIWYDSSQTSWKTQSLITADTTMTDASPIVAMKAVKNHIEIQGMMTAHEADALALIRFMHWLSTHWETGITECSAAERLAEYRLANPLCRDLSFPSISAFGKNGAIIHYSPSKKTDCTINNDAIYLLDSGGQYWGGTTDVTRCMHLGTPSSEERHHYTLVLKAHLALRHAVFAEGTTGYALDCVTRQHLWREGYDFGHGTGHGVGAYLYVHEGPHSISPRPSPVAMEEHMVVSNEPGLYLDSQYGIRIENLMAVVTAHEAKPEKGLRKKVLTFMDLTLVPYAKNLIDTALLNEEEKKQINEYHQLIATRLSDSLNNEPDVLTWLKEQMTPLC